MKYLIIFSIFVFTIVSSGVVVAQSASRPWTVGLGVGYGNYYGDLSHYRIQNLGDIGRLRHFVLPNRNYIDLPSIHVSAERHLSQKSGLLFSANLTNITMSDRYLNRDGVLQRNSRNFDRALNFRSEIYDAGIAYKLRSSSNAFITTSIWAGGGISYFRTFGDLFDEQGNAYDYSMPNVNRDERYETNLRNELTETDNRYSNVVPFVNLGLGINFRLSNNVLLSVESDVKYSFSDYLDDVSGQYKPEYPNARQAYIARPGTNTINPVTLQRGDNDNLNDFYIMNRVVIRYSLFTDRGPGSSTGFRAPPVYPVFYSDYYTGRVSNDDSSEISKRDTTTGGSAEVAANDVSTEESVAVRDTLGMLREIISVEPVRLQGTKHVIPARDSSPTDFSSTVLSRMDSLERRVKELEEMPARNRYERQIDTLRARINSINSKRSRTATDELRRQVYGLQIDSIRNRAEKEGLKLQNGDNRTRPVNVGTLNTEPEDERADLVVVSSTEQVNRDEVKSSNLNRQEALRRRIDSLSMALEARRSAPAAVQQQGDTSAARRTDRRARTPASTVEEIEYKIDSLERMRDERRQSAGNRDTVTRVRESRNSGSDSARVSARTSPSTEDIEKTIDSLERVRDERQQTSSPADSISRARDTRSPLRASDQARGDTTIRRRSSDEVLTDTRTPEQFENTIDSLERELNQQQQSSDADTASAARATRASARESADTAAQRRSSDARTSASRADMQSRVDSLERELDGEQQSAAAANEEIRTGSSPEEVRLTDTVTQARITALNQKVERLLADEDQDDPDPAVAGAAMEANRLMRANDSLKILALQQRLRANEEVVKTQNEQLRWYNRPFRQRDARQVEQLQQENERLRFQIDTRQRELNRIGGYDYNQNWNRTSRQQRRMDSRRMSEIEDIHNDINMLRQEMGSNTPYQPAFIAAPAPSIRESMERNSEIDALRDELRQYAASNPPVDTAQTADSLDYAKTNGTDSLRLLINMIDSLRAELALLSQAEIEPERETEPAPVVRLNTIPASVYFDLGAVKATDQQLNGLEALDNLIRTSGIRTVKLDAFTDATGNRQINERIAQSRARFVRDVLQSQYQIAQQNFDVQVHVKQGAKGKANALDRRVDISLYGTRQAGGN